MDTQEIADTPMMMQWRACKEVAKEALLFFRMGDFYEAFYEDATLLAKELELTLTKRQDIPMCGVPHHTCESYIDKMIAKGYRVAIAEQTEDPKKAKGLVKREVVRVVTPGTIVTSSLLSDKANNYFASITQLGSLFGLAVVDLTTAEFFVLELEKESDLLNELYRLKPAEVLTSYKFADKHKVLLDELKHSFTFLLNPCDNWFYEHQMAYDFMASHFKVHSLDGLGLRGMLAAINAAGALLRYLQDILCLTVTHLQQIELQTTAQFMALDKSTQRNLELTEALYDGSRKNTLLGILDHTNTPMGARLLRNWVKQPLLALSEIAQRQDAVQAFIEDKVTLQALHSALETVRDLERLMMRVCTGYASPRDLVSLRFSLEPIPQIKNLLQRIVGASTLLSQEWQKLDPLPQVTQRLAQALVEDPPLRLSDGNIFRDEFHPELLNLREISRDSKSWLARYQNELKEQTGIKTLKVGYNKMFGYYIEVSKGQAERMPESFYRRQTLVNAERFITPQLKDYETKVLTAEERINAIETELFHALRQEIANYAPQVQAMAQALARIDALHALALTAVQHNYVRPIVDDSLDLKIEEGRHPVIEACHVGEKFIANDTLLDGKDNRLLLITGPNMAGKSTYIRQVALIAIMAQIGSFVPAQSVRMGIVDKVFSRIGASDDLSRGHSTFMVEMSETANILNNATNRSLVILDEIGRGTSTYDGISIAWAVAEYLLTCEDRMAKTLFATHYWELTKLEEKVPGAVNYNVAVHETGDQIVFLRKIIRGGTDKSYGIHVARLAGIPALVIGRAKEILLHLEENANRKSAFEPSKAKKISSLKPKRISSELQLTFFG